MADGGSRVIALTSPYLWYTARATGTVALVLLTASVVLGAFVSTRMGGHRIGRFELNEFHRSLSTMALCFVAIHVTVTVIDSYVPTGVLSVIIPFASPYRRVAVAIGAIAIDLMLAVWITSMLKSRIHPTAWRQVHWLSWGCLGSAICHGFLTGSDAHRTWSLVVTGSCALAAVCAGFWRVLKRPERAGGRTAHSPIRRPGRPVPAPVTSKEKPEKPEKPALVRSGATSRAVPPPAPPRASPRGR
jgi:DMSO/TMAO reductase YedYZ heme-binding membrane subunit